MVLVNMIIAERVHKLTDGEPANVRDQVGISSFPQVRPSISVLPHLNIV
jgi:hypothetical protein